MTKRRPLALCAAATIGFGSLFIASPALAESTDTADTGAVQAPADQKPETTTPESVPANAEELPAGLDEAAKKAIDSAQDFEEQTGGKAIATGTNADGDLVLLADKNAKTEKADSYAEASESDAQTAFAQVLFTDPAVAFSANDVVGGAGYLIGTDATPDQYACSVGFSAWDSSGKPALISAGHCTSDGSLPTVSLSKPSAEPAVGGEGFVSNGTGIAGYFGFWRHGGPDGSTGAENDPASTDISVIDLSNGDLKPLPAITDWSTAAQDDLAAGTTPVKSVADPAAGSVSKSGRTTGLTTGDTTVTLEDEAGNPQNIEILDGWVRISNRWVHGFLSDVLSDHGDSGGAVFQGDKAVGLISGGPEDLSWTWSTRLKDALTYTGGYEVALDIDAPVVTSHEEGATVEPGTKISGTAASNATKVSTSTASGSGDTQDVKDGKWETQAPEAEGDYTLSVTAQNGHSRSKTTEFTFTVKKPDPKAPATPVINATDTDASEATVTGSGEAGSTVKVTVDGKTQEVKVGDDGKWSTKFKLEIGKYPATAVAERDGLTSGTANGDVTVRPVAPTIESPANGASIPNEDAPDAVSGTGIAGAKLVFDDGQAAQKGEAQARAEQNATVDEDGNWSVDLGEKLSAGTYSFSATQEVNGVASKAASATFTVETASVAPTPTPGPEEPNPVPSDPKQPVASTPGQTGALPVTGATIDFLPYGISAVVMLLIGGAAIALVARRQQREQEG